MHPGEPDRGPRWLDFGAPGALYRARRVLEAGQIAVLPTENLYGFSVLAASASAVGRLRELKGRDAHHPFVGLAASVQAVESMVDRESCTEALEHLRRLWPAPLTAVLPLRAARPWGERLESRGTAAFRVPAHERLRQLLKGLGGVVLSTSVNRTGRAPLRRLADIADEFGAAADVALFRDRRLEEAARAAVPAPASTVVDCTTWPPRLLRPGAYDLERAGVAVSQTKPASGG